MLLVFIDNLTLHPWLAKLWCFANLGACARARTSASKYLNLQMHCVNAQIEMEMEEKTEEDKSKIHMQQIPRAREKKAIERIFSVYNWIDAKIFIAYFCHKKSQNLQ